jgi:hypothetical protein
MPEDEEHLQRSLFMDSTHKNALSEFQYPLHLSDRIPIYTPTCVDLLQHDEVQRREHS